MNKTQLEMVAALDLGSNSFHLVVARVIDGRLKVVDRMKEMVRLAAGLNEENILCEQVADRALACLRRFGERLGDMPHGSVRVVGTNTLRKARNSYDFILQAEAALGHRIDIIGGREEARLIYLGVSHDLEDESEQRLVIDIGGGSTELILGEHFRPLYMESLHMGCVSMSKRFFPDGVIDQCSLRAAKIAALRELEAIKTRYRSLGWATVIGSSGTILAIHAVVRAHGMSKNGLGRDAIAILSAAIIEAGHVDNLRFDGLPAERAPVFPGGIAILSAVCESLEIDTMGISDGALREGLLYDLLGRIHEQDIRAGTVTMLAESYHTDLEQALRVKSTALELLAQCAQPWELRGVELARLLAWAAELHEMGLAVSHSQYHKHGGYLLSHMDLPGFARGEQQQLACLVRGHRRRFPNDEFQRLPDDMVRPMMRLCVLLRLAVVLHRHRSETARPKIRIHASEHKIQLKFPRKWLHDRSLIRVDLEQEASYLKAVGIALRIS